MRSLRMIFQAYGCSLRSSSVLVLLTVGCLLGACDKVRKEDSASPNLPKSSSDAVPTSNGSPVPLPKNPEALDKLAGAVRAQMSRDNSTALELFREALALDPTLKGVQYQMAVVVMNQGDEAEAGRLAYAAIAAGDSVPQAYNLIGTMAARRRDFPVAAWAFQKGAEASPADPMILYNWSEALRAQGQTAEAIEKLRAAIQRNPGEPLYALKLRLARIEAGEEKDLIPDVDRELALTPPAGDWLMTAAAIALKHGRYQDAASLLTDAQRSMQPILFFGLLQEDPFFSKFKEQPMIAPFYDVEISIQKPGAQGGGTKAEP